MNFLTKGFELTTAITNLIIFIVSICCYKNIKKKNIWNKFYLFLIFDSFLGIIVHGIKMSTMINNILWVILAVLFTFTINIMFCIFLKLRLKFGRILSILLSILLLTELVLGLNFILTFVFYIVVIMLISVFYIYKFDYKNKNIFLIGFLVQLIGGILMLFGTKFWILDHNGICHLFTAITLIIFYIGIKKNEK